jgi:hypothetical protein
MPKIPCRKLCVAELAKSLNEGVEFFTKWNKVTPKANNKHGSYNQQGMSFL